MTQATSYIYTYITYTAEKKENALIILSAMEIHC